MSKQTKYALLLALGVASCQGRPLEDVGQRTAALGEPSGYDLVGGVDGPLQVDEGAVATYQAFVINADGLGTAHGVIVSGTLSGAELLEIVSDFPCTMTSDSFSCSVGDVGEADAKVFDLQVRAPDAPGTLRIDATVSYDGPDPNPDNNTGFIESMIGPVADLAVTLSGPEQVVSRGGQGTVTYTATVTNVGEADAQGVFVSVGIPESTTLVAAPEGCVPGEFSNVSCPVGTLAPGASATVTVTVRVGPSAVWLLGFADATLTGIEPNTWNNFAGLTTIVTGAATTETTVTTVPTRFLVRVPCTGETLRISGEQHLVMSSSFNLNREHRSLTYVPRGITVVGDDGTIYRVLGVDHRIDNFDSDFGEQYEVTFTVNIDLVSHGSTPNYSLQERVHVVVVNGEVVVETNIETITCK